MKVKKRFVLVKKINRLDFSQLQVNKNQRI